MNQSNYFYCYDKKLFKFLHDKQGIDYITVAIHPTTRKTFSMFMKSDRLQMALDTFNSKG